MLYIEVFESISNKHLCHFFFSKGKISFYANPKLCYKNKIEKLLNLTGQKEDFGMQLTNGNKVACEYSVSHGLVVIAGAG